MTKVTTNKNHEDQFANPFFAQKKTSIKRDDMVSYVAEKLGITKILAKAVLDEFVKAICGSMVMGNKVRVPDLGTFETKRRKEGTARNPKTGVPIYVPAMLIASFRPGKFLKALMREGKFLKAFETSK